VAAEVVAVCAAEGAVAAAAAGECAGGG